MRPISKVRSEIRDVFHSIKEVETSYYQQALDVSLDWGKRFATGLPKNDLVTFQDYVFALKYATLALKAVKADLKKTNNITRMENCAVDPDTGTLRDWRIAVLNEIRFETHRDIVDWDSRYPRITVADMSSLED
jgi:hypothetical protein